MFDDYLPISINMQNLYYKHLTNLKGSLPSSYFFPSLHAWDFSISNFWHIHEEYMCIIVYHVPQNEYFALPPIGPLNPRSYISAIIHIYNSFHQQNLPCIFIDIPAFLLPYFNSLGRQYQLKTAYDITESEYLFTLDTFIAGFTKPSARTALNHLHRKHKVFHRKLTENDKEIVLAITKNFYCTTHICEKCVFGCDLIFQTRIMDNYKSLDVLGVIVYLDDEPSAFQISFIKRDTIFCLNKKVKHGLRGINEFTNLITAEPFTGICSFVNYSDDMGIEGLRSYKQRIGEHALLHRYFTEVIQLPDKKEGD